MARLGAFIDVTTLASVAANGTLTFAHGLPASPDFVLAFALASAASATTWFGWAPTWDATNVTLQNPGSATTPSVRVISVVAHSIIR